MRRFALVVCAASMLFGAEPFTHRAKLPAVGSWMKAPRVPGLMRLCMISPGQMDKCANVQVSGVKYSVAFRKKGRFGKPVVTNIYTSDTKFISPSGDRVGDLLEVSFSQVVPAPGFEIYAGGAVGGWTAVVGFAGKVATDSSVEQRVDLDSLRNQSGTLRLRIIGFVSR